MYLVVCYDVSCNKRRRRLFKALNGFLHPVQRSVFEGALPERRCPALRRAVERVINPTHDTVRIYHISPTAVPLIELLGVSPLITEEPEDIII